jgi:hypothetical protein
MLCGLLGAIDAALAIALAVTYVRLRGEVRELGRLMAERERLAVAMRSLREQRPPSSPGS